MNNILNIDSDLVREKLSSEFTLHERKGKLYLQTPFYHSDGDGLHIIIKVDDDGNYVVSDEGHSLMRLSYDLKISQIKSGTRHEIIQSLLSHYGIENRLGEFCIKTDSTNLVNAILNFIHFCIRLEDIEYLSRENARNTFIEDFKRETKVELGRFAEIDWYDRERDERGDYTVDILLNRKDNYFGIFPMFTNHQLMSNTITIYNLREWGYKFDFIGVIQDKDKVSKSNINKFSDASEKLYYLNDNSKDSVLNDLQSLLTA